MSFQNVWVAKVLGTYNNSKMNDREEHLSSTITEELDDKAILTEARKGENGNRTKEIDTKNHFENICHALENVENAKNEIKLDSIKNPRPPVPGGEEYCISQFSETGKGSHMVDQDLFHGDGCGDGLAVVESGEGASPSFGGTPPPIRWSESLYHLLDDELGVALFKKFLIEEIGNCSSLDFRFACKGLNEQVKKSKSDGINHCDALQKMVKLVAIICKHFIQNNSVKISIDTRSTILKRIQEGNVDPHIFDKAKEEVEREMANTTYISFLKSDLYLNYLAEVQHQHGCGDSPHFSGSSSSSPPRAWNGGNLGPNGFLPTVEEDSELPALSSNHPLTLTQSTLAATIRYRATADRRKPEACAGLYLHDGTHHSVLNPYHASYSTGHFVSQQDSELQSFSSDALTDDARSYTDSSVDGVSSCLARPLNPRQIKKQYYKMRENARQNKELALAQAGIMPPGCVSSASTNVPFVPRTHRMIKDPTSQMSCKEFAQMLIERLEKVKREREAQEKIQESFKKIQEGEDATDEYRRQYAVNSLPPSVLLDRLAQKIPLDDQDQSQSILDRHVSRVWEDSNNSSPICTPGSPRAKSPICRKTFTRCSGIQPLRISKGSALGGNPSSNSSHMGPSPYFCGPNFNKDFVNVHGSSHHPSHPYHHGPDVHSTFSSDSGNVADFCELGSERLLPPRFMPKSCSMPDYMENYAGTSSDGGNSGKRQGPGGRRSSSRKLPADLTDSGVSVVSDSGPFVMAAKRVQNWLLENELSTVPLSEKESKMVLANSRFSHASAVSISSNSLRPSFARKTAVSENLERSSSVGLTSLLPCSIYSDVEDKKKNSASRSSYGAFASGDLFLSKNAMLADISTSSISGGAVKKQRARHSSSLGGDSSGSTASVSVNPGVTAHSTESTTLVYNFYDDSVPFVTKVQMRPVTLRKFKQHLPKKGNYRFFFKKHCEEFGVIQEEILDDNEVLPLFEGKIFAHIQKAD